MSSRGRAVLGSRREQALRVAASLPGEGHVVVGADLADADAVRDMVAQAAAALGGSTR